jgi:hypothetical protein
MLASQPAKKQSKNVDAFFCFFLYLIFPVVTLILLRTNPWLPDRSPCDPNQKHPVYVPSAPSNRSSDTEDEVPPVAQLVIKMMPCTCKSEFPVTVSVLAGIEIFIFVWFAWSNPLVNARGKEPSEKCSTASYGLYSFAIAYFTFLILSFIFMIQSSQHCGIAIFFWTLMSSVFRGYIICFYVALYEHEVDKNSDGEPIAL